MPHSTAVLTPNSSLPKLPARFAVRWKILALEKKTDGTLLFGACQPENLEIKENLRAYLNCPFELIHLSESDFDRLMKEHYGLGADALEELPLLNNDQKPAPEIELEETAMIRFVNDLIRQAQHDRATDIHIEPFDKDLLIRLRIDGMLHPISIPPTLIQHSQRLVSRIKVMAGLNIAERRLPQDGRIRFNNKEEEEMDIRVSTLPTIHGESIDLRLLPRRRLIRGLAELGMPPEIVSTLEKLIHKPNGIILVTGPTGHGKTTTLYAALSQLNKPEKKIITIEDPVEYRLHGINQIQVHSKIGFTFSNGLRSILRQDPDIIMVGEIRDKDTAEIAIRASLTGHLVLSTLHTNDSIGAITRLVDMGIEPYLVASSITAVLAQRLVRKICTFCQGIKTKNCDQCRGSGFYSRSGLFEMLLMTDPMQELILTQASNSVIRAKARSEKMKTLFQDGQEKIRAGQTTLEEVLRVTEEL